MHILEIVPASALFIFPSIIYTFLHLCLFCVILPPHDFLCLWYTILTHSTFLPSEPKFVVKSQPVDFNQNSETEQPFGPTATKEQDQDATTAIPSADPPRRKTSVPPIHLQDNSHTLFEKVQALSLITTPSQSVDPSPITSPHISPGSSPLAQRRLLGMAMEPRRKISAHSYFCTKQFEDPHKDAAGNATLPNERGLTLETSVRATQLEENAIAQQALDPKMMGRKRRQPKPSTLREMNFWAPTSM